METVQIKFIEPKPEKSFVRMVNKLLLLNSSVNLTEKIRSLQEPDDHTTDTNRGESIKNARPIDTSVQPDLVVVDIRKVIKNPAAFHLNFENESAGKRPFLLLNVGNKLFNHIILKYDGTEDSINSIKLFSIIFPEKAKQAKYSSLISPLTFRRHQVMLEKKFVKKISPLYGEMGFIKLPLNSIKDFIEYAIKEKADLLILPQTDLDHLIKFISSDQFKQYGHHPLSFFTAVG